MKCSMVILTILLILSCNSKKENTLGDEINDKHKSVLIAVVEETEVHEYGRSYGKVIPSRTVQIFPRIAGKILERLVEPGDDILEGQLMFKMIQDIPGMKFEPEEIRAPISGSVARIQAEVGSRVTPQTMIAEIINRQMTFFQANIPAEDYMKILNSKKFEIELDSWPGKPLSAKLDRIYPQADPKTAMVQVRFIIQAGMSIPAGIAGVLRYPKNLIRGFAVPLDALSGEGIRHYLWVVRNGVAHRVRVEPVIYENKMVICRGELFSGDSVIVAGWNQIAEKEKVHAVLRGKTAD